MHRRIQDLGVKVIANEHSNVCDKREALAWIVSASEVSDYDHFRRANNTKASSGGLQSSDDQAPEEAEVEAAAISFLSVSVSAVLRTPARFNQGRAAAHAVSPLLRQLLGDLPKVLRYDAQSRARLFSTRLEDMGTQLLISISSRGKGENEKQNSALPCLFALFIQIQQAVRFSETIASLNALPDDTKACCGSMRDGE